MLTASDSAEIYFIMTKFVDVVKGRKNETPALQTKILKWGLSNGKTERYTMRAGSTVASIQQNQKGRE
jgi:hypothetical protein